MPRQAEEAREQHLIAGAAASGEQGDKEQPQPALLQFEDQSGAQQVFALAGERELTIGRGEDADLRLSWDPSVSLLHAVLIRLGAHWLIADEGVSRNGTFVNGARLSGRRRLRDRDMVRVGATTLAFHDPGARRPDATTISDAPSASGTVTLLFCDLVGSTELIDRLGDAEGERVRREHLALLREAAGEHGGREVKSLGDGLMVAFASALAAVACASSMQLRIVARAASGQDSLGLRVGLNAGEVMTAEDDYFGSAVVVAARLCDQASAGQILVSGVLHSLVAAHSGHRFCAVGPLALKGFSEPLQTFALEWQPQRSRSGSSA